MNLCCITVLPFLPFIIFSLVIFYLLLLRFFSNTSTSNNTSEDTPSNNILTTPEIPSCFEGLEEQWAELNKDGRDFRNEIWFKSHISMSRKENITPLEHLANFLRRTYQEVGSDEESLQEENLSEEDDNVSDYEEFELCLTDESSSEEDPVDK
ncbi:unnamed protein product [Rhizophagus irregularis]|uniref:Uncharacterized protein n=1 Tax=Rhizophagus irregularis TaxID=588596 RepID=A0A2I1HC59_9GLOM|nr:hypothetical protein RhiirA4_507205 [Rhizophagus irregularis]CAB4431852.1 unnamed protein product [Rhizophagus irregularis]